MRKFLYKLFDLNNPNQRQTENPLAKKLTFALKITTDEGMVSYLKRIEDEKVNAILTLPEDQIRAAIERLLNEENNKQP